MKRQLSIGLALLLCSGTACTVHAQKSNQKGAKSAANSGGALPERAVPQGMRQLETGNTGRVLVTRPSGSASARKMLQALMIVASEYFDSKPTLVTAFVNRDDTNVQAAFTAQLAGQPVRGIIAASTHGEQAEGAMVFDRPQALRASFPKLVSTLGGPTGNPSRPAAPVQLTMTPLPDGSGKVGLPPGYRITGAYKGTVDIVGPNQEAMALGGVVAVVPPMYGQRYPQMPAVNFTDPARAAMDLVAWGARRSGVTDLQIKVLDVRYIPFNGHKAALMRYHVGMAGKSMEGFGLFSILPVDEGSGILYTSFVAAPTGVFDRSLPAMYQSWMSWGVSDATIRERLLSAAQSMRGIGDIITSTNANRQEVYGHVNKAWDEYIRDTWTYSGSEGRVTGVPGAYADAMAAAGYAPVPIGQL